MEDTIKDRIRKVYELSQRGFEGEKDAAELRLQEMLTRYGLTMADILDETKIEHKIYTADKKETAILLRIILDYFGSASETWQTIREYNLQRERKLKKEVVYVRMTKAEAIDIQNIFNFYRAEFKAYLKRMMDDVAIAFCNAQGMGDAMPREHDPKEVKKEFDWEAWRRRQALSATVEKKTYHKRLAQDL